MKIPRLIINYVVKCKSERWKIIPKAVKDIESYHEMLEVDGWLIVMRRSYIVDKIALMAFNERRRVGLEEYREADLMSDDK